MSVRRGNERENLVVAELRRHAYCVASRRHLAGPGDLLAVAPLSRRQRPLLVEVKGTAGPWDHFREEDRGAMLLAEDAWDVEPILAWVPVPSKIVWLPPEDWPGDFGPADGPLQGRNPPVPPRCPSCNGLSSIDGCRDAWHARW